MRRRRWVGLLFVAMATSCATTSSAFSPYSSTSIKQSLTGEVVRVYPGDLPKLRDAGAEFVGIVNVAGNAFASVDDIRETALGEAASYGGTHVFIGDEEATTNWARVTPDRATTTYSGNAATTTFRPGQSVPITFHSGTYVIIRVPPENWALLPSVLQPRPNAYGLRLIEHARAKDAEVHPNRGWWCAVAGETSMVCERTLEACKERRAKIKVAGMNSDECQARQHEAFCFSAYNGPAKQSAANCFGNIHQCQAGRDAFNASTDWTLEGDCELKE